ncbi:CTD kinase subunit alpha [Pseudozyma hubeiensis]|nr:CTD kinase subunit alpha [Pseudozyma hubeiensis]
MPSDRWQPRRNPDPDRQSRTNLNNSDRFGESSRSAQRTRYSPAPERDEDRSDFPNKQRRLGDRDARRASPSARDRNDDRAGPSSPRRSDSARDTARPPALSIRGVASNLTSSSPMTPRENDDVKPRRARSPDLFDRLSRRADYTNGSSRPRPESSLRSRLEAEKNPVDSSDPPRRGIAKLAPRGQYDESGRRIDDASGSTDSRDPSRRPVARNNIPTSPRKRDPAPRRQRDRSSSPATSDRPRYRATDDDQDSRYRGSQSSRNDRTRISQRSPSPTSGGASRSQWGRSSDRHDRYDRRRSPSPRSGDRFAPNEGNRERRWGARAQPDDRDEESAPSRRRRTPSPARSDVSNRSHRRDRDTQATHRPARDRDADDVPERDRQRDRPARWRMNNDDRDSEMSAVRERNTNNDRDRPQSSDDRRARSPPRPGRSDESTADRGHVLSRKAGVNATFDGVQPPTGPRRQDPETNQRSVRGGGWQTVRPGARRDRDASANAIDRAPAPRNGHDAATAGEEVQKAKPALTEAVPVEPTRAEPGEAYETIHQVGEGTYGQVFKARSERTGALVALKKIRMDSEKDGFPVTAMREIKLLQALRHDNVVRLHEMMVTRGSIYMVFEYMEHDLNGILAHPQVSFTEAHLKSLSHQLFSGLDYLHRKAVLHRDLKGSNILLNNQGRLKLADFGLARFYAKRRSGDYTNRVVTLWYRPPELLFGETQYGSEVDMWGAGCIFVELFVKKPVFQSETEIGQVQAITDIMGPVTKRNWPDVDKLAWYEMVKPPSRDDEQERDHVKQAFGKYLSESALQVARGLLTYDPKKRWSAKDAMAAEFFAEEPKMELPAGLLSSLQGEWHEYESRRAKKKASAQRGTDSVVATTVRSTVQDQ